MSQRRKVSHVISAVDQYSALELERDTVDCFFERQEMQFTVRNI